MQPYFLIMKSFTDKCSCKMMLAVTHSPFIFDNELDEVAQDLDVFVQSIDAELN